MYEHLDIFPDRVCVLLQYESRGISMQEKLDYEQVVNSVQNSAYYESIAEEISELLCELNEEFTSNGYPAPMTDVDSIEQYTGVEIRKRLLQQEAC